ncbi:G protein-coupled glucose receptor regulating Gpa2-domain-containing protein [Xylariomycetidae sp. FL2044]|nr:G protein-coupled glucose receptor regulating Gpa2-domain-containing protein [Xylariomycetidae sp. FL2044]
MATNSDGVPLAYYEAPDSMPVMDSETYAGLMAIGLLATASLLLTSALLTFITWRMIAWRKHYTSFIGRNQSIVLIYQLILADFLQSLGFIISFHWVADRNIVGPSGECFAQGMLIQLGDVASGFFVLAIAVHTTYQVVLSRSLSHTAFVWSICGVWGAAVLLCSLAPVVGGRYVFMRAGVWCWIRSNREDLRLGLHYVWIFIVQFGSILVYTGGFLYLFRAKRPGVIRIQGASIEALNKAATAMLAYALVYTVLTLPLAAGRMASMSDNPLSNAYYLFAGCLFTSAGWVDTILYTFTRRTILFNELNLGPRSNQSGHGGPGLPFQRQASTDSMLAETGFGGIKMDRTVKVEMDDLASHGSSDGEVKGYHVSASAYS